MDSKRIIIAGLHDVESLKEICENEGLRFNDYTGKKKSSLGFQDGDLVWAKMRGFPPWPAQIQLFKDEITTKANKNKSYVLFFGSKDYAWIPDKNIMPHNECILNTFSKNKSKALKQAIQELKEACLKSSIIPSKKRRIDTDNRESNANSLSQSNELDMANNIEREQSIEKLPHDNEPIVRDASLENLQNSSNHDWQIVHSPEKLTHIFVGEPSNIDPLGFCAESGHSSLNQEHLNDCNSDVIDVVNSLNSNQNVQPLSFHTTHGKNIILLKNRSVVSTKSRIYASAYAFTERPIEIGEKIVMIVRRITSFPPLSLLYESRLMYGITSCDPKNICPHELPEEMDDLLDRPEYWIVKQKRYAYKIGDVIAFKINSQGQVEVTINGILKSVFYVECTQSLWLFVNLADCISELRLAGVIKNNSYVNDASEPCDALEKAIPGPSGFQSFGECVICFEKRVNCVLYRCGHMCMCYTCAFKLWVSGSRAQCPICRNPIQDVIKIYQ